MNKTAIKNFAVWARQKLISDITYKAGMLGITENGIAEKLPQSTSDLHFFDIGTKNYSEVSGIEIIQREALVKAIREREHSSKSFKEAFNNTVEEVAYTWFNRLIAIRFMEVNDYLPSGIRVLSSENKKKNEPDFVTTPFDTDLNFTPYEQDRVIQLKDENKLDKLFRMLFIKQCNKLHDILPDLFEKTDDYSELLLTISFTDKDGIVYRLVHDIDEVDFRINDEMYSENGKIKADGQVEIIGWMYQYYNSELKDDTFAKLKKKIKIEKDRIPAATQLFTPDWIVRYMVENSLGRVFSEQLAVSSGQCIVGSEEERINSQKKFAEEMGWKYFLPDAPQSAEVRAQLSTLTTKHSSLTTVKLIDPCMGSGHILVYAFDVFMQVYESYGYTQREAAKSILANNIFGLDIDKRAYQLSYFALMMKARQYNRRIFNESIKPNVFYIRDNSHLTSVLIDHIANGNSKIKADLKSIADDLKDAAEYGSLVSVTPVDFDAIFKRLDELKKGEIDIFSVDINEHIMPVIRQAEVLSKKYDVVCTNPPYMGAANMGPILNQFIKEKYADYKSDFFSAFIVRAIQMTNEDGYCGFFTPYVWMFIQSYEKLRLLLCGQKTIETLIQFEYSAFEEATVPVCTFVFRNRHISKKGCYLRLTDFRGGMEVQQQKTLEAIANHNCGYYYETSTENFSKIPGSPIAYWVSEKFTDTFICRKLDDFGKTRQGLATGDNEKFLRLWHECNFTNIFWSCSNHEESYRSTFKWYPCTKGGSFRRWYGNLEYVVNWYHDGEEIKQYNGSVIRNYNFYFKKAYTWSTISSGKFSMRYAPVGSIFESKGSKCFVEDDNFNYVLALLNTCVAQAMLSILAPTLDYHEGPVSKIPIKFPYNNSDFERVHKLVEKNIDLSKQDWDSFETSWDFKRHPLLPRPIEDNHIYFCLKIGEKKWIRALKDGQICFNIVNCYIKKAETGCNNEQGDLYEGVFARLHKTNPKITEMQDKLRSDLEIIPDGDYVMLRRYSTRNIPIFCIYGIFREDLKPIGDVIKNDDGTYTIKTRIDISTKMYKDFLNKEDIWGFYVSSGHFFESVESALREKKYAFKRNRINYTEKSKKEYFIEPTDNRDELFYKHPCYSYQNEERILLPDLQRDDKLTLNYESVGNRSGNIASGGLFMEAKARGKKKVDILISDCYEVWATECEERFNTLKANEEELNRIFIDIYGLQDELTPEVEDRDVTVHYIADTRDEAPAGLQKSPYLRTKRDEIVSLISYAVGCMFGRYSIDNEGLTYAGGSWDNSKYSSFMPDKDNCIPITDEEYFEDDIVGLFCKWLKVVYGEKTLEENLNFIAKALGNKGNTSREVIRNYFLNDFIKNHIKTYQKRPIYWLFDSGKQNGFKALCYMHRWNADTTGNMRVEYLHRIQRVYEKEMNRMQEIIEVSHDNKEISNAMKRKEKLQKQFKETKDYDALVAHLALSRIDIDLDDGVKVNYEKVQTGKDGKKMQLLVKI